MELVFRYRWALLVITVAFCLCGSRFISTALQPNNDLKVWFDQSDPALKDYYEFQEEFGNDRIITLAYEEENGILTTNCLQKIGRLVEGLEQLEGIENVLSIVNAKDIRKLVNGQRISYKLASWFDGDFDRIDKTLTDEILSSSLYKNKLINEKGDITIVVIQLESFDLVHNKIGPIVTNIKNLAVEVLGKGSFYLSGSDIINYGLNELSRKDFIKFTGLSYLVMFIMITFFYRRFAYVLLAFLIAFSAIWLTFSVYGLLGYGINIFTIMTPTLIIVIGLMISMHILNEFESSNSNDFKSNSVKSIHCLKSIVRPCFFTAITTMAGFLSLLTSSTAVIKEFGWLTALGCIMAFILAFVWSSILLPYIKVNEKEQKISTHLGNTMLRFSHYILNRSTFFLLISFAIVFVSIWGARTIKIDMNPISYFPSNNDVLRDHQYLEENWGDYYPIDLVLETSASKKITDRDIINAIVTFDANIVERQLARNTFSFVKVMERYAYVRYQEKLSKVLYSPVLNKQFSNSFERMVKDESNFLVTDDNKKARITITGSLQSVRALERSIAELNQIGDDVFGDSAELKISGYPSLFIRIMNASFDSMRSSLLVASALVFFIMFFLLRSFKIATIAIVVNLFPVLVMFGFLGFSGINLDLATCTIAAIILGIAIDDTIHILYKYQQERKAGHAVKDSLLNTHFHVGRVVVLTSIVLIVGFSVLMLASLKTVLYFGLLSIMAVIAVMFGDLVLLTLLLKIVNIDPSSK